MMYACEVVYLRGIALTPTELWRRSRFTRPAQRNCPSSGVNWTTSTLAGTFQRVLCPCKATRALASGSEVVPSRTASCVTAAAKRGLGVQPST